MAKPEQAQQKILEKSGELFIHYGFDKTTMEDIACAAKCSKRTLYNYFNDKEEIYVAVINDKLKAIKVHLSNIITNQHASVGIKLGDYLTERMELLNSFLLYAAILNEDLLNQNFKNGGVKDVINNFREWEYGNFVMLANEFVLMHRENVGFNSEYLADMLQMETKALDSLFFTQKKYTQYKQSYNLILTLLQDALENNCNSNKL